MVYRQKKNAEEKKCQYFDLKLMKKKIRVENLDQIWETILVVGINWSSIEWWSFDANS